MAYYVDLGSGYEYEGESDFVPYGTLANPLPLPTTATPVTIQLATSESLDQVAAGTVAASSKVTVRELDYYIPDVEPPSLKHMTITGYKREAQILFDPACPKTLKHTSKAKGGFSPALKSLLRAHAQGRGCVQKKKAIGTERGV